MRIGHLAVALGLLVIGTTAQAQRSDDDSHFKLALSLGSLGIGPEVTYRPNRFVGVRAMATLFAVNHTADIDGITYRGKLKLGNYGGMVDLYPFRNGFRISGGARYADNRLKLRATPAGPITIGAGSYTPAQVGTLSGDITTRHIEPIATIGYGGTMAKGLSFGIDAGVMFQGKPKMSTLTTTSALVSATDLARERADMQNDIDKYKFYPVVQLSAGYRF